MITIMEMGAPGQTNCPFPGAPIGADICFWRKSGAICPMAVSLVSPIALQPHRTQATFWQTHSWPALSPIGLYTALNCTALHCTKMQQPDEWPSDSANACETAPLDTARPAPNTRWASAPSCHAPYGHLLSAAGPLPLVRGRASHDLL